MFFMKCYIIFFRDESEATARGGEEGSRAREGGGGDRAHEGEGSAHRRIEEDSGQSGIVGRSERSELGAVRCCRRLYFGL